MTLQQGRAGYILTLQEAIHGAWNCSATSGKMLVFSVMVRGWKKPTYGFVPAGQSLPTIAKAKVEQVYTVGGKVGE